MAASGEMGERSTCAMSAGAMALRSGGAPSNADASTSGFAASPLLQPPHPIKTSPNKARLLDMAGSYRTAAALQSPRRELASGARAHRIALVCRHDQERGPSAQLAPCGRDRP